MKEKCVRCWIFCRGIIDEKVPVNNDGDNAEHDITCTHMYTLHTHIVHRYTYMKTFISRASGRARMRSTTL